MKLLSLSVALALGATSTLALANDINPVIGEANYVFTQEQVLDKNAKLIKRLAQHGLNAKTRPHLFNLIEQRANFKTSKVMPSTLNQAPVDCKSANKALCSFFMHTGVSIRTDTRTNKPHLVVTAVNSKTYSTEYTMLDIVLMNEKGEYLTLPKYIEYFGDGAEQKRKEILSSTPLENILTQLQNSEAIFADAWITVTHTDASGRQVVEDQNVIVEYPLATLLDQIAGVNAKVSGKSADFTVMNGPEPIIHHPKDTRSKTGGPDNKITVCLNRNYGDCDYENIYPTSTPNDQLKLKIPFQGEYTITGKVTRIYRPDWTVLDAVETDKGVELEVGNNGNPVIKPSVVNLGSNIFIQTKEGGGANEIAGNQYQDIANFFANNIKLEYFIVGGRTRTKISWNIPRAQGVFGDASLYGRYADANWILNISADIETRPGRPRPGTLVVGSTPEQGSWAFTDYPQMQIVYSCLAEGSLITLPGGKQVPIESLQIGDTVLGASEYSPSSHTQLTIADISVGVEAIPMTQITTRSGKELLLTESHPVVMRSGKSVWASKVELGDVIHTQDGPESVSKIETVKFVDNVYNLRLERSKDDPQYKVGETFSLFANGVQVGDLGMQSENEFTEIVETEQDILNRLPEAWHKDYLNSLKQ
ncbi:Hint domain-containing protein [Pseudoalteromonas luteoviolacea]|uniref:Hint domain-containing protein n=1 Tax=Pseudoalteromonas luteoviolacea S4054 TaxID=1129367 RepID=A0A0F6AIB9_9GAMM|nr:Hint domain-containing protein [Pseudoalteromonas luteoviolacea]AOT09948.1 hypothetical protein S4054249_19910 [Pseudoalteromonas luteoviolacea]AOT14859.1 hypothetical protein S40542_19880 [Pseudoalteromonas luteoviolacea]AOT19775.1 hypothetical protein S4054_19885 [Pseudoalteromonas luteoviolacea]KKE85199.1 hypothetical protein N479_05560 [Pseudoalteromonas luteoviolacea S4054]KZN63969.1 hypothetical protein N481_02805 [Pseudoalteromonas luteoviolacea S4047-1]